jgi:putative intracellular protease/amidase
MLEVAIPWKQFVDAGFDVTFATETGKQPACDEKMLTGWTGALLGASKSAKRAYYELVEESANFKKPLAWSNESFTLDEYDLVFLAGGHEKGVRQIMDSGRVHALLAVYFPKTKKPSSKSIVAICHGVQVLAHAHYNDGKSILHDCRTTALVHTMEQGIFHTTRLALGDYYKTYGAGTPSVEEVVKSKLDDPSQFQGSLSLTPYVLCL